MNRKKSQRQDRGKTIEKQKELNKNTTTTNEFSRIQVMDTHICSFINNPLCRLQRHSILIMKAMRSDACRRVWCREMEWTSV